MSADFANALAAVEWAALHPLANWLETDDDDS